MATQTPQFKPVHIVIIVCIFILSGLFFVFKDKIIPDINAPYKTEFATFIKTDAVIVSQSSNGRVGRGAATLWTIQFKDQNKETKTVEIKQTNILGKSNGESVTIYYNPSNPNKVVSEEEYLEIMK
jgi:hypothetical protein